MNESTFKKISTATTYKGIWEILQNKNKRDDKV